MTTVNHEAYLIIIQFRLISKDNKTSLTLSRAMNQNKFDID